MKVSCFLFAATASAAALGPHRPGKNGPDADGRYTLEAEGIKAQFIPYAATLTNLWVKDKNGIERDIVLGYDNTSYYPVDPGHPVYNAIPGRYANRIGNGTFKIDGVQYNLTKNDGPNTLHSGPNNWSFQFWKVEKVSKTSITFSLSDDGKSTNMPGRVDASVTYSVSPYKWNIEINAVSPEKKTPIQVTQHTYFQLDAFANPNNNRTIWNHDFYMPYAHRVMEADENALPTGVIAKVPKGDTDDFWSRPKKFGFAANHSDFENHCGNGCHGYNGNWAFDDRRPKDAVVATLSSEFTGIKADLRTNQDGIVIYTCNWNDGKSEFKDTQGKKSDKDKFIPRDGCVAIEAQDYVDGINHPEWGRLDEQIFGPGDKYHWESSWTFGVTGKKHY